LHAEAIVRIGDVVLERDRAAGVAEAMRLYREAMAVQESLIREYPNELGLRDDLCWSYDRIGDLGDKWQALPDAELEAWLNQRVVLSESLLALNPERAHSRYNLATGHLRLARFLGVRARNEASAAAVAEGLPHIWAAVQAEPDRTMFVQILVSMLGWDVRTLVTLGRHGEVPAAVQKYVDTARAQVRLQPGDVASEGIFISVLGQAARTLLEIERHEEARLYAQEGLDRLPDLKAIVSPSRVSELDEEEAFLRELLHQVP
jgi:tetratricopeptide (TPR) repeat protein